MDFNVPRKPVVRLSRGIHNSTRSRDYGLVIIDYRGVFKPEGEFEFGCCLNRYCKCLAVLGPNRGDIAQTYKVFRVPFNPCMHTRA